MGSRLRGWWRRFTSPPVMLALIWCCMLFFAVQAACLAVGYVFGPVQEFDALFRDKYVSHLWLVRTHAVGSVLALCLGLAQMLFRGGVHTLVGRLYGCGVLVGGLTSLPMALMAEGGWTAKLAFFLQGVLWLASMVMAVRAARNRKFALHRRFMVRNYALTYSAVGFRLLLNGLQQSGLDFERVYPVVAWTWLPALALAEWWLSYSAQLIPSKKAP